MESFNISSHSTSARSPPLNRTRGGERSQNFNLELPPVNHADPDSANPNQPANPALNNTSTTFDQNATGAALLDTIRDDNGEPPPERSLSDMERGEASSQTQRRNENLMNAAKACLLISGELGLASIGIRFTSTKPLSHNTSILLSSAEFSSVAGFSLCSCGYALQNVNTNNRRFEAAAGMLTKVGIVFTAGAFMLLIVGTNF